MKASHKIKIEGNPLFGRVKASYVDIIISQNTCIIDTFSSVAAWILENKITDVSIEVNFSYDNEKLTNG
ncbi:MAG: hypothetical protein Q7R33_04810 [Nitrosarchaeum sp.]|nr:hypothetical protein [Nitrosarchaeum sp.]